VARSFTGVSEIVKVEGAYHGQHESVCVSFQPSLEEAIGPKHSPNAVVYASGIPEEISQLTIVIPFNCSREIIQSQISKAKKKVACIIVEPILMNCGIIFPRQQFLEDLRSICSEQNIVLIFDEVKTNTTIASGGVVQTYGVIPDIICLGKSCSGGIPFGALGMNEEIGSYVASGEVSVNSTFGGNLLAVSCCLTTLNEIMIPSAYECIIGLNQLLKLRLENVMKLHSICGRVSTLGAKGCLLFMDHFPVDYRDWKENNAHALSYALHSFLVNHGIWMSGPGEEWTISIAHSEQDLEFFVTAVDTFFSLWLSTNTNYDS
jgi:glutamate-1-semialdehyde 2,1-aminomutase